MPRLFSTIGRHRHFLVPVAFLMLIVVLVVPLPPAMLDVLLAFNISLGAVILLTTIYMNRALDFSVFPAILIATTLLRLVLNVASTRLILTADAPTAAAAEGVAGQVIQAFGTFVSGESIIVGVIIFLILVVVQFVVITKGATRMSEVAARFTLDAMPGKQMAIDADLSAGLIDEKQARVRREEIMAEADFYGAMDGASKFVRGDAIAGLVITAVNILGGFAIGAFERGWGMVESLDVFTRLTIGDGLASQVPSFIVAIAAGLIVARAGRQQTIGEQIPAQLTAQPIALALISGFLVVLALTPLPTLPLLAASVVCGATAWGVRTNGRNVAEADEERARAESAPPSTERPVEELLTLDALEIEIGYGLVRVVDAQRGGDLLDRISLLRRQLAVEIGLVVPPVRIRDNMQLDANDYRAKLRGAVIGRGTVHPDRLMAMNSGAAREAVPGIPGVEPAFGLEAIWVEPDERSRAETAGYTVVDATSVIATHLTELVRRHAHELLTREEVGHLVDQLRTAAPKLVDEVIPGVVRLGELQKVLQELLREGVPIRDLEVILETIGDRATQTKDLLVLTEYVRHALRRTITALHAEVAADGRRVLSCVTVDPALEALVGGALDAGSGGIRLDMSPVLARRIAAAVSEAATTLVTGGHRLVILTTPAVRPHLKAILDAHLADAVVLSYSEVTRDVDVQSLGLVHSPRDGDAPQGPADVTLDGSALRDAVGAPAAVG